MEQILPGIYKKKDKLTTKGKSIEVWNPYISKPAAAILNGLKDFPLKKGQKVLYLGAAHGTTVSHFSNIVGDKGLIYGVEISTKIISNLVEKVKKKSNVVPLLEDARFPEKYGWIGNVDLIYEDIAQRDPVEILKRNTKFLKKGTYFMLALKAKSIDSVKDVKVTYENVLKELKKDFEIVETITLEPYERDHLFIVGKV